ncbi:MAG: Lrp/AsnC family transcriptional regulator [Pseudomonadota bacterium]
MDENTNGVQRRRRADPIIDTTDRRLLSLMANDARLSFAELGQEVNLSAPAVHERVKKLRGMGAIKKTAAVLDGATIGRPLLAFVSVTMAGRSRRAEYIAFQNDPDIEEVHSVAGDACLLLKVRCANAEGLEALLTRIYDVGEVTATNSTIVLSTIFERGPQP